MAIMLAPDQIATLQRMDVQLRSIEAEIKRAKSAGIDVTPQETKLNEIKKLRAGLLRVYGGGAAVQGSSL